MASWNNIPGTFSVEIMNIGGKVCETDCHDLPMLNDFVQPWKDLELIIEFVSSGTYQRASMYGGSDRLGWPEERSEDRELVRAYLLDWKTEIELPVEVQQQLFEFYAKEIDAVELDSKGGAQ